MKKIKSRLVYLNESPGIEPYDRTNSYSYYPYNSTNNNHYNSKESSNYSHESNNNNNSYSYSGYMSHQALSSLQKVKTVKREKSPSPDYKNRSRIPHTQSPSKQIQDYFSIQAKKKARAIKMNKNKMSTSLLIPSQGSSQSSKSLFESLYKGTNISFGGSVIDFKMNRTMSNKNSMNQHNNNNRMQMTQSEEQQQQNISRTQSKKQLKLKQKYNSNSNLKQRQIQMQNQNNQSSSNQSKKKLIIKQKQQQKEKEKDIQKQKRKLKIKTTFQQNFNKQSLLQNNNNNNKNKDKDNIYFPGHKHNNYDNYNNNYNSTKLNTITTNPSPTATVSKLTNPHHNNDNNYISYNNNHNKNHSNINYISTNLQNDQYNIYNHQNYNSVPSLKQNYNSYNPYNEDQTISPYSHTMNLNSFNNHTNPYQKTKTSTYYELDSYHPEGYQYQHQYEQINKRIRLQQPQSVKNTKDSQKFNNQNKLFKSIHNNNNKNNSNNNNTPKNNHYYAYDHSPNRNNLQNTVKISKANTKDEKHQNNQYQSSKNSIRINRSKQKQKPNLNLLFKKQKQKQKQKRQEGYYYENEIINNRNRNNYQRLQDLQDESNQLQQSGQFSYYTPKRFNQQQGQNISKKNKANNQSQQIKQIKTKQQQPTSNINEKNVNVNVDKSQSNNIKKDVNNKKNVKVNVNNDRTAHQQNYQELKAQNQLLKRSIVNYQQLMEKHHSLMKKHQKMETEMEYLINQLQSNNNKNNNKNSQKNRNKKQTKQQSKTSNDYIRISQNLQDQEEEYQQQYTQGPSISNNDQHEIHEEQEQQEQLSESEIQRENKHINNIKDKEKDKSSIKQGSNDKNKQQITQKKQSVFVKNNLKPSKDKVQKQNQQKTSIQQRKRFSIGYKIRRGIDKHGNLDLDETSTQKTQKQRTHNNNSQMQKQKRNKTQQTLLTEQEQEESIDDIRNNNRNKINNSNSSFQIYNQNNQNLSYIFSMPLKSNIHGQQLQLGEESFKKSQSYKYKMLLEMNKKLADTLSLQTQDNHILIVQNQKLVEERGNLQKQITNWMDKIMQIKEEISKVDKLSNQFSEFKASINNSVKQSLRNTDKRLEQLRRQLKMNLIDRNSNTYTFNKKESMPTFGKLSSGEQQMQMLQHDIRHAAFSQNNSLQTSFQISHSSRSAQTQQKQNQKLLQQMRKQNQEQNYVYIAPQNEQILISQSSGKYGFSQQKQKQVLRQKQRWIQQQNGDYKQFDKSSKADSIPTRQRQQSFISIKCSGLDQNFFYQHKYEHLMKQHNNNGQEIYGNYLGSKQNSQNSQNSEIKINMQSSGQTQLLREAIKPQKQEKFNKINENSGNNSIVNINMNATVSNASNLSPSQRQSRQQQNSLDKVQKEYIAQLESEAQQMRSLITSITLERDHLKKSMKGKIETIDQLQRSLKQINLTLEEVHQKPASSLRQEKTFRYPSQQSLKHTKSQTSMRDQFSFNQNNQQQQMFIQNQDESQADRQYRKTREIVLNLIRIVREMIDQYGGHPKQTAKFNFLN